jgi:hypothetical protein
MPLIKHNIGLVAKVHDLMTADQRLIITNVAEKAEFV